ncbi:MAG: hypothetical protein ACRD6W_08465 [Nitrososphaerales archaeon]
MVVVSAIAAILIVVVAILPVGILTSRTTTTYFVTSTAIAGTTTLTEFPPGQLYDVTFKEGDGCGGYIYPWGVLLGNLSISQPPNVQLSQISESGFNSSGKFALTTISFSVPSGTYPFTIYPTAWIRPPLNNTNVGNLRGSGGTVTVSDSNVTIDTQSGEICV